MALFFWAVLGGPAAMAAVQEPELPATLHVTGTVTELKKYTFRIQSGEQEYTIGLAPNATIRQRIQRPVFEFAKRRIVPELHGLPQLEPDSEPAVTIGLPAPLYIRAWYPTAKEMERFWESGTVRRLTRYELSDRPPEQPCTFRPDRLELAGQIETIDSRGVAVIDCAGERVQAQLQDREASLAGGTILDLLPFVTVIEAVVVPAREEMGGADKAGASSPRFMATKVIFTRIPDPLLTEDPALPRVLWLGDESAIAMLSATRKELAGVANLQRPVENCGGSANVDRLATWLGPWRQPGRQWDVIVVNFGRHDLATDDAEYVRRLGQWIEQLRATGAKLVWHPTLRRVPAETENQARFDALNQLALAELKAHHPGVAICDPMAGLDPAALGQFKPPEWWSHVARALAASIKSAR
jgi:hypothetical protein